MGIRQFIDLSDNNRELLWEVSGCPNEKKEADFSGINAVCELAMLKCYYWKSIWTRSL